MLKFITHTFFFMRKQKKNVRFIFASQDQNLNQSKVIQIDENETKSK